MSVTSDAAVDDVLFQQLLIDPFLTIFNSIRYDDTREHIIECVYLILKENGPDLVGAWQPLLPIVQAVARENGQATAGGRGGAASR